MSLWTCSTRWGARAPPGHARRPTRADGYTPVATLADLPAGASRRVYVRRRGRALQTCKAPCTQSANRCTHARASLSEGTIDPTRCTVTCPWHEVSFSLEAGQVLGRSASLPVAAYSVKLEGDTVLIAQPRRASRRCPHTPDDSRFLKACRSQPTDVTPGGHCASRGATSRNTARCGSGTRCSSCVTSPSWRHRSRCKPVERLGVDGRHLFADILLRSSPWDWDSRSRREKGPQITRPIREASQVLELPPVDPATTWPT